MEIDKVLVKLAFDDRLTYLEKRCAPTTAMLNSIKYQVSELLVALIQIRNNCKNGSSLTEKLVKTIPNARPITTLRNKYDTSDKDSVSLRTEKSLQSTNISMAVPRQATRTNQASKRLRKNEPQPSALPQAQRSTNTAKSKAQTAQSQKIAVPGMLKNSNSNSSNSQLRVKRGFVGAGKAKESKETKTQEPQPLLFEADEEHEQMLERSFVQSVYTEQHDDDLLLLREEEEDLLLPLRDQDPPLLSETQATKTIAPQQRSGSAAKMRKMQEILSDQEGNSFDLLNSLSDLHLSRYLSRGSNGNDSNVKNLDLTGLQVNQPILLLLDQDIQNASSCIEQEQQQIQSAKQIILNLMRGNIDQLEKLKMSNLRGRALQNILAQQLQDIDEQIQPYASMNLIEEYENKFTYSVRAQRALNAIDPDDIELLIQAESPDTRIVTLLHSFLTLNGKNLPDKTEKWKIIQQYLVDSKGELIKQTRELWKSATTIDEQYLVQFQFLLSENPFIIQVGVYCEQHYHQFDALDATAAMLSCCLLEIAQKLGLTADSDTHATRAFYKKKVQFLNKVKQILQDFMDSVQRDEKLSNQNH